MRAWCRPFRSPRELLASCSQFCEGRHWRFIALVGAERKLYYWNPYGLPLPPSHALADGLSAHEGWAVESILYTLQSDSHQCGPWSHSALEMFVQYFRDGAFGGFGNVFVQHERLRPLNLADRGRTASAAAEAVNTAFVVAVRDEMRKALQQADQDGDMPFPAPTAVVVPLSKNATRALRRKGNTAEEGIVV